MNNKTSREASSFIMMLKRFWDTFNWAIIASVSIVILTKVIFFIGIVPSPSMEDTILPGSIIIGNRWHKHFDYEDILVFDAPDSNTYLIKRVIGKGGDTIYFQDGKVIRNGEVLNEPYVKGITINPESATTEVYEVPEGMLFMMGDNRENSLDSRYWSSPYLPESAVFSNAFLYWQVITPDEDIEEVPTS